MNDKRSRQRDEKLALTVNRKKLLEHLNELLDQSNSATRTESSRVCLIILDIRDFRALNHSFGEECGDAILQAIYKRLSNVVQDDSHLFYLGNDEFGIAIDNLHSESVLLLYVDQILAIFKQIYEWKNHTLKITVNTGVAYNYESHDDANQLLYDAELALRQAKAQNLPYQVLGKKDRSQSDKLKWELLEELHQAMSDGDLSLYYQPKLALTEKRLEGQNLQHSAEALVRWQNKTHGLISPATTLPLIEHLGTELDLVNWLVNTALKNLHDDKNDYGVSVNVPANSVTTLELFSVVEAALARWPVHPNRLTLEVTEDVLIRDKELAFDCLNKIRELGVRIAIDDFGTGYSSLSYFKHIPADELKIDKAFIDGMKNNTDDMNIVKLIIELAHSFDLNVVAEGVEDQETIELLTSLGCDYIQGFAVSHPLPYSEFIIWLQQQ